MQSLIEFLSGPASNGFYSIKQNFVSTEICFDNIGFTVQCEENNVLNSFYALLFPSSDLF